MGVLACEADGMIAFVDLSRANLRRDKASSSEEESGAIGSFCVVRDEGTSGLTGETTGEGSRKRVFFPFPGVFALYGRHSSDSASEGNTARLRF